MKAFILAGIIVAQVCGIPPIPPIPPIGCKAMQAVCVCNSDGSQCWWTFQCVGA
jgi:hypothetical protein